MDPKIDPKHIMPEIQTAMNVAMFKKDVMSHVAGDAGKTKFGYYIIVAAAILGMIGQMLFLGWLRPSIGSALIGAVLQVVSSVLSIYVVSFVAQKFFKGAASHDQFFRVAAYGMIVMWLSILPQISIISGIWSLALFFVILQTVHKLTTGAAVGTLLVSVVVMIVVSMVLGAIGLSAGVMGGGYGGRSSSFGSKGFNFNSPDGAGSINFGSGGMKIKTPDGEVNFSVPN